MASGTKLRNEQAVQHYIMNYILSAVEYVFEKVKEENEKSIQEVVYDSYQSDWYPRTYEFKNAWDTELNKPTIVGNGVIGEFAYNPNKVHWDGQAPFPEFYQHGNKYYPSINNLADIIYNGFQQGRWGNSMAPRNAFDDLLKTVTKQQIVDWLKEYMTKKGFTVR